MGNRQRGAVFRQSLRDFPCPVTLGESSPSFGLHRYRQGLRFIPADDEGFTLRGDKQRLTYKGWRRSHRFTILNDTAFEYDCILHREPESNVISLLIEGAENYDFLKQPYFVENPFLKGSFAVYKKQTLVGEGTGKLCHIHRPEIIDARGRRCWGSLAVVGNELHITIPEKWLSEASYPVVVDPTVGTTTVGSQYMHVWEEGEPAEDLYFEVSIPVNRFTLPELLNGNCTGYVYTNADDWEAGGRPVLYSDNGNSPSVRKSANEGFLDLRVTSNKPPGWRSTTFQSNGSIASGSNIWFGVFTDFWFPRFDYGAKCYSDFYDDEDVIPNIYPIYNVNWYDNFRLSMYFTYTSAQNYVYRIAQSVKLTDTFSKTGTYTKRLSQTAGVNSLFSRFEAIVRKCILTVNIPMGIDRVPEFFRNVAENIKVTMTKNESLEFSRYCNDSIKVFSINSAIHVIIRKIEEIFNSSDTQTFTMLYVRSLPETVQVTQTYRHLGDFFRGLPDKADNTAETRHETEYYRFTADKVLTAGTALRGLSMVIRIITRLFIKDYILGRFLKAREELTLKSAISPEIILESKID